MTFNPITWARRLFMAPRLIQLHARQSILVVDVENASKDLWVACEENHPPFAQARLSKRLEKLAEELSDVQAQVLKIWG